MSVLSGQRLQTQWREMHMCYTEKAPNAWHRRGTQKTGNTYNQPNRASTDTPHRPSTKHYRKGSPGDA